MKLQIDRIKVVIKRSKPNKGEEENKSKKGRRVVVVVVVVVVYSVYVYKE